VGGVLLGRLGEASVDCGRFSWPCIGVGQDGVDKREECRSGLVGRATARVQVSLFVMAVIPCDSVASLQGCSLCSALGLQQANE